ncbi:uncharacterized protein LOC129610294 [Condylostylus longicornis]|uniref:uncharacterized protein LOC129610294 n=1 Tax=Condylostylus longicornis TaxID=2530218 RepID=UPI00244DD077|nr:uncharacterized protein LOC129610294 [Condylostylus longicornis]
MSKTSLNKKIIKITPYPDELVPYKRVKCPLCDNVFLNSGNLLMHLARHHKNFNGSKGRRLEALPKEVNEEEYQKLYFCPIEDCIYNERVLNGGRYFTNMKYIRQHYQKVHIEKSFACKKCSKTFSTIGIQSAHEIICGKKFECGTCGNYYTTREALLTHTKRKKHQPFEETEKKTATKVPIPKLQSSNPIENHNPTNENSSETQQKFMQIQYSNENINLSEIKVNPIQYIYLVKVAFEAKDQESQTDELNIENSFSNEQYNTNICPVNVNVVENKKTEAKEIVISSLQERDIYQNQDNFQSYYEDSCFDQLVTETNLCDIETQTEIPSVLDQLLHYSNTHTQTCDDFLQELCLADIQTQTNWSISNDSFCSETNSKTNEISYYASKENKGKIKKTEINQANGTSGAHDELLVSTETQTSFTQCLLECGNDDNVTNAASCITQHTQTDELLLEGLFGSQDENDFIANFQSTHTQT